MNDILGDAFGNTLFGTDGDDRYFGLGGFDLLFASRGSDTLDGGADSLDGGLQTDVALYEGGLFPNGVFINNTETAIGTVLAHRVDKRGFGIDTLIDVSNFHGSNFDDVIHVGGNGGTYTFDRGGDDYVEASQRAGAGNHVFFAGSGNDTLVGSVSRDRVEYGDTQFDAAGPVIQGVTVDLAAGTAIDGFGDNDTLISIERVDGTRFDDTLRGDAARNDFNGLQGNDILDGRGGDRDRAEYDEDPAGVIVDLGAGTATDGWGDTDTLVSIERVRGSSFGDTLIGSSGDDTLRGDAGDDLIRGLAGNDELQGDDGADTLDGGADFDVIGHFDDPAGVVVDLAASAVTDGWGNTDTLISIEGVDGSPFDDTLRGDDGDNFLDGRAGDDLLEGRDGGFDQFRGSQGNDTLDGGAGRDRAEYHRDADRGGTEGVNVNLATGTARDGFGDTDTLIDIEEVLGTRFADTIIGDASDNYIEGNEGDDSLSGGDGADNFRGSEGNDTIDGGDAPAEFRGGDRVSYDEEENRGATGGVNVNLGTGVAIDSFGTIDTLISIEEVRGTNFDDTLTGGGASEQLQGRGGNDTLIGGDGNDDLNGGDGNDSLVGGRGGDFFEPGTGADVIEGGDNGPLFEDDELSYLFEARDSGTANGITVSFATEDGGSVVDFGGDTDVFSGIERVRGTQNADTFIGAAGNQIFLGLGGDDSFDGGAGDRDRVDYSRADEDTGADRGLDVSLAAGSGTDANGDTDTFANIEEIRGSHFDDQITGDGNKNELRGELGNDRLDSFGGTDNYLSGGRGNDTVAARGDSDAVDGGEGNDLITFFGAGGFVAPGLGSDTIVGGSEGFFHLSYDDLGQDVIIDVALGRTTIVGSADVDIFTNIVNVEGGAGDDTLLGNDGERQEFFSSRGDDFIDGRGTGEGGDEDWLIYHETAPETATDAERAVVVDFSNGTVTGILAGTDTFINIEAVRSSRADDRLIGSDQEYEQFQPMAGSDTVDGRAGRDRINYSFEDNRGGTQAIIIDLAGPVNDDGFLEVKDTFGHTDFLKGIEEVTGSAFDDEIAGTDGENRLIGLEGADTLIGRGGEDFLWGGQDIDRMSGGAGADEFGGFIEFFDGDTITDFSIEDSISIFDSAFNQVAANAEIVGNELRLDTTGDGVAEAVLILENGYTGPVRVTGGPIGGPEAVVFEIEAAGRFAAVVEEGSGVATVTVTRTGDVLSAATVDLTVSGAGLDPAEAADLTTPFGTPVQLSFAPGEEQITYEIGITGDLATEPAEDLAVILSNPASAGAGGAEIAVATTFVRILDDDIPPLVRIDGENRAEDAGGITFTVSRTGDLSQAITVPYQITSALGIQGAEPDDLVAGLPQAGQVEIAAGASTASFTIAVVPDTVAETHDDILATISTGPDWPAGLKIGSAQAIGSIRNDDGRPSDLPPGATASNYGDPHLLTFDGLAYDFQAVGEFTLVEAASGDPLEVQVRYQPVAGSEVASQTTAVATTLGTARVVIDIDGSSLVSVGGAGFDLSTAVGGAELGDGRIFFDGEAITLVYANGEQLRVDLFEGFLATSMSVGLDRDLRGLLGNADGDTSNDLALRDGTVLAQPVAFADLYGPFAEAWRISNATSLFDYAPGQGTEDFTDTGFPVAGLTLDDFPIEVVASAQAAVAGIEDPVLRDAAVLDYLVSGDAAFIAAAAVVDDGPAEVTAEAAPTGAPGIPAGIGISASQAEIVEGDDGAQQVSFTVYRTGDLSEAVGVAYRIGGTADAEDYTGPASGSLEFAPGEASVAVTLDITGDGRVEANETLSVSFEVTSGPTPVLISSTASVTIVNDDLAPVVPPLNPIEGTGGSDLVHGTDGADLINGLGGRFDKLFGLDGADVFVFGGEAQDGARDRDIIMDYEVGIDSILLTDGATVGAIRDTNAGAVIFLEGDGDAIYVRGADIDPDTLTIVTDDLTIG